MSPDDPRTTIDHATIRRWVESCGGEPAAVSADAAEEAGMLRLRFPDALERDDGDADHSVESLDWSDFFERFEEQELALVFRDDDGDGEDETRGGTDDGSKPRPWYEFEDRVFAGKF